MERLWQKRDGSKELSPEQLHELWLDTEKRWMAEDLLKAIRPREALENMTVIFDGKTIHTPKTLENN